MPKVIRPLDVYKFLPQTNCQKCGEPNCMAFAVKLIDRETKVEQCTPFFDEKEKYGDKLEKLVELLRPGVKDVVIGVGDQAVTVGSKTVVFRHELTYFNPTAIMADVHDEMSEQEILDRVKYVNEFKIERIFQELTLNMIAIRSVSDNADKFAKTVALVAKNTQKPLMIASLNPTVLEAGLKEAADRRPLIYAATKNNWSEVLNLTLKYKCPVAIFSPNDLQTLKAISHTFREQGVDDIVLDPGTFVKGSTFADTLDNFAMIRRAGVENEDRDLGYPLLAIPAMIWLSPEENEEMTKFMEALLASLLITRFADLLLVHSLDVWVLMAMLVQRQAIYTDPRFPVAVKPGLEEVGKPDEASPVFFTSNYALTYATVKADIESAKLNGYMLVVDTEGLSVQTAVAGRKLTADKVAEAIKETGLNDKVKHKTIVSPGFAARLAGELEEISGWKVLIGPRDSGDIGKFIDKVWKPEGG